MKILIGHNSYQKFGGEDSVVKAEIALLKHFGHTVVSYERSNKELNDYSVLQKLSHTFNISYNQKSYARLRELLEKEKPDVAHFHNIHFMMSPSVYDACRDAGVPVVQSLHNFRLFCSNALFFRDGHVCEDCLEKTLLEGVKHKCYRDSYLSTAIVAKMISDHWKKKTWMTKVDRYITATDFTKQKYVQGGIAADKISIKPNVFYPDTSNRAGHQEHALYVGRLSREKGVEVLLRAWRSLPEVSLKILGDGPLADELREFVRINKMAQVEFLGFADQTTYESMMRKAKFLVIPSQCYENFPRVVVEALAYGVPIIASRLGSLQELIKEGQNGWLFDPKDDQDLLEKVKSVIEDKEALEKAQRQARLDFEQNHSPEKNYKMLMEIYQKVLKKGQ